MVLLVAAIFTKQGKCIVSRHFVEMTRSRAEGLLGAFPKLMNTGKQHTFVETDSVRYVYQPMEQLYMVLVTTKSSNILEDLDTLRLFSKVVTEYTQLDEYDVSRASFDLIFAFDEIIALGYKESVNLAQIRTFTEMDSHEERVYEAMRKSQERDAIEEMKRRSKELQQQKKEGRRPHGGFGGGGGYGGGAGMGSKSFSSADSMSSSSYDTTPKQSYTSTPSKSVGATALKLGKKKDNIDTFVKKIEKEGQRVTSIAGKSNTTTKTVAPTVQQAPVHVKISERITIAADKDSGLQSMEVLGVMNLRISEGEFSKIVLAFDNREERGIQFQTNPNIDKRLFNEQSVVGLKGEGRPFPISQDVPILKWRLHSSDDQLIPLFINCWPSENEGTCDVNVEYELMQNYLELNNVVISIPVPSGVGAPVVGSVDGDHHYDSRKHVLEWCLPVIDSSNSSGTIEFSMPARPSDFFPVKVSFTSPKTYCHVGISNVSLVSDGQPAKFSTEVSLTTEKFEIV